MFKTLVNRFRRQPSTKRNAGPPAIFPDQVCLCKDPVVYQATRYVYVQGKGFCTDIIFINPDALVKREDGNVKFDMLYACTAVKEPVFLVYCRDGTVLTLKSDAATESLCIPEPEPDF